MSAVAVDSSSFIGYLNGRPGADTAAVQDRAGGGGGRAASARRHRGVVAAGRLGGSRFELLGVIPRLPLLAELLGAGRPPAWPSHRRRPPGPSGRHLDRPDAVWISDVPLITADRDFQTLRLARPPPRRLTNYQHTRMAKRKTRTLALRLDPPTIRAARPAARLRRPAAGPAAACRATASARSRCTTRRRAAI